MSLIRGSYPNYRRTSYKQKQKIPLKMGKEPEKRFFQKIINGPLPPLIVILSQLKKMFSLSSNCFNLKFQREQMMCTESVRTLDSLCDVWLQSLVQDGHEIQVCSNRKTKFSLPTFVFTSTEENSFFLWSRIYELKLTKTTEFRLKMEPRLEKQSYEM